MTIQSYCCVDVMNVVCLVQRVIAVTTANMTRGIIACSIQVLSNCNAWLGNLQSGGKEMVGSQIKKATDIVHEISTGDLMSVYIIVTLFAVIIAAPIMIQ